MTKLQFLLELNNQLSDFPRSEVEDRLTFYSEMIEDRMEEGLTEEDAVAAIGPVDKIAFQIRQELLGKEVKKYESIQSIPDRRLSGGEIALLILGAPLWLSLMVAAFAVILSLYVSLWSVIISFWAVFGSVAGCSVGGIIAGTVLTAVGKSMPGVTLLGAGIFCCGLSILLFFGCKGATKGVLLLSKKVFDAIKKRFARKERVL